MYFRVAITAPISCQLEFMSLPRSHELDEARFNVLRKRLDIRTVANYEFFQHLRGPVRTRLGA